MIETAKKYAFALGREQEISLTELKSVLHRFGFYFDIYRISGNIVFAKMENFSKADAATIINVLGGTIKIYELVDSLGNNISNQIADLFIAEKSGVEGKINLGVSCFNKRLTIQRINSFALGAKKKLKGRFSLRYVEPKEGLLLSSIQTLKNNLAGKGIEFGIFEEEIGVLIALNNPEAWNKRDYDKPAFDKYSGMVPPKLARAMVNLALGQNGITNNELRIMDNNIVSNHDSLFMIHNSERPLVVDPFCGSGNILMEAIELGCDVIGSDNSPKAVRDSEQNCEWLLSQGQGSRAKSPGFEIFRADASSKELVEILNPRLLTLGSNKNVVFVTEPYLGEPKKFKTSFNATVGEYKKIYELYLAFLSNIAKLINCSIVGAPDSVPVTNNNSTIQQYSNSSLCLIFPLIETVDHGQFSLYKECVDEIKKLGYTQVRPSMVYGREYQVVKREIVFLKLT